MAADQPPNLRFADSDRDCSGCAGFKPESQTCAMFSDWPVSPDLVCDAWEAKENAPVRADGESD